MISCNLNTKNGLPFDVKKEPYVSQKGLETLYALNREATNNGKNGMSEFTGAISELKEMMGNKKELKSLDALIDEIKVTHVR